MASHQQCSPNAPIAAISWTGGKDCHLTLLYAHRNPNLNVQYLITFCPANKPFRAHPISIMKAQAKSLGLELIFVTIPEGTTDYMQAYVDGIRSVKEKYGISVICTGDMNLVGSMTRNWMERACEKVGDGMSVYLPLWKKDPYESMKEILDEGFDIIFSCVKSPFFDGSWINRKLDWEAVHEMKAIIERGRTEDQIKQGTKPLDLCGERGEYHTMVIGGPLYNETLEIDSNCEPLMDALENVTKWKGNIHNAEFIWMISLRDIPVQLNQ